MNASNPHEHRPVNRHVPMAACAAALAAFFILAAGCGSAPVAVAGEADAVLPPGPKPDADWMARLREDDGR